MNMNGWDTVYAVSLETANRALGRSLGELIPSVSRTISGALGQFAVSAEFGPWKIALGGSEQLIVLQVPIAKGKVVKVNGPEYSLAGYEALFSISLKLLKSAENSRDLAFDFAVAGSLGQAPAPSTVVPLGFAGAGPDPTVGGIALDALAAGLVEEADKISFAFAAINLVPPGTNGWLAPVNLAYGFFQSIAGSAFLAILSTKGDPSALSVKIDPVLISDGAQSGFAFSLQLFFNNCLIPAMAANLPDDPVDGFGLDDHDPPGIVTTRSLGMDSTRVGAIDYYPSIDSFSASPVPGKMQIVTSGGCDVYAGLSMSWSTRTANDFAFDAEKQTIGFASEGSPEVEHDVDIPWYYWAISPLITEIADGVASLIGDSIASFIGDKVSGGIMAAAPPETVRFAGMRAFRTTQAIMDGAIILKGDTIE